MIIYNFNKKLDKNIYLKLIKLGIDESQIKEIDRD